MKVLHDQTAASIKAELENIPIEYQKDFNSAHEGYAVLLEEVKELEKEVFWGAKEARKHLEETTGTARGWEAYHRHRMRQEAIQIAAMAIRFYQEI